jgi:hypothetical protein
MIFLWLGSRLCFALYHSKMGKAIGCRTFPKCGTGDWTTHLVLRPFLLENGPTLGLLPYTWTPKTLLGAMHFFFW